jgi:phage gpG-like protein
MSPEEFSATLERFEKHLTSGSFRKPLQDMVDIFHEGVRENFIRAADDMGQAWAPRKVEPADGHPLLIDTSAMLKAAEEEGFAGNITQVEDREFTAGIDSAVIQYAPYHQFGTRKMPARKYFYADAEALERMDEALLDYTSDLL